MARGLHPSGGMEQNDLSRTNKMVIDGLIWFFFTVLTSTAIYMMASVPSENLPG
jgi:hypothetical protein